MFIVSSLYEWVSSLNINPTVRLRESCSISKAEKVPKGRVVDVPVTGDKDALTEPSISITFFGNLTQIT